MPLVAYDTSDDEDSPGDEKIESPVKSVVSVTGKVDYPANSQSVDGKLLANNNSVGIVNGCSIPDDDDYDDDDDDGDIGYSVGTKGNDLVDDLESSSKLLGKLPGIGKKLPAPSTLSTGLSDIVVVDKKSKRIKVVIPSIDELDYASEEEEEEVGPKRKIIPAGGCSLSSFLPKPKNAPPRYNCNNLFSTPLADNSSPSPSSSSFNSSVKSVASLVPHSVSRPKTKIPPKRPQNVPIKSDEDIEDSGSVDFFSLGDVSQSISQNDNHLDTNINKIIPIVVPKPETESSFNEMMMNKLANETSTSSYYAYPQAQATTSSKKYHPSTADINDPDYKKFVASKFGEETADKINIVEVNVGNYLANDTELLRSISMESGSTSVKGPAPSPLAKRKNQITYLAYQAKQRELDLKNEAANNRFTKSQTRAKYGF